MIGTQAKPHLDATTAGPQLRALVALGALWLCFSISVPPVGAQVTCSASQSAAAQLINLFAGFVPHDVGSYSLHMGKKTCQHKFEQHPKHPSWYESCENWECHKKLEVIGVGAVAGVEVDDGQKATLGDSRFGATEVLTLKHVNAGRTELDGTSGLNLLLLGKTLKLPRQSFSMKIKSDQTSELDWNTLDLNAKIPVRTPYGTFEFDFEAEQSGNGPASDRQALYQGYEAGNSVHDWDWYKKPSSYWNEAKLANSWRIAVASPPLVEGKGLISYSLKLVVGADIDGYWRHRNPHASEYLGTEYHSQVMTWNRLESEGVADGRIRVTIDAPFYEYTKEWQIISVHTNADNYPDGPGRVVADYTVSYKGELTPCSGTPTDPAGVPWVQTVVTTPAQDRPPEQPPDLTEFGTAVTQEVKARFFLCDARSKPYDPSSDPELGKLATSIKDPKKSKTQFDQDCSKLRDFFKDRFFLCERSDGGLTTYKKTKSEICLPKSR